MTPEQFCYWLQGRAELVAGPPDAAQWEAIVQHLSLVFTKVTPPGPGQLAPADAVQPRRSPLGSWPVPSFPQVPGALPWPTNSPTRRADIIC